jgi:hypothetical protein
VASPSAPDFYVTYAQTSLLLAEAAKRGWVSGGDAQARIYYESGIAADMTYSLFPEQLLFLPRIWLHMSPTPL